LRKSSERKKFAFCDLVHGRITARDCFGGKGTKHTDFYLLRSDIPPIRHFGYLLLITWSEDRVDRLTKKKETLC
jgi:hypothetical protein